MGVAVVHMLKNTPPKFQAFKPAMRRIFLKHADSYIKTLESYVAKDGTSVQSPIWKFNVKYRAADVISEIRALREQLQKEEPDASSTQQNGAALTSEKCGDKRSMDTEQP